MSRVLELISKASYQKNALNDFTNLPGKAGSYAQTQTRGEAQCERSNKHAMPVNCRRKAEKVQSQRPTSPQCIQRRFKLLYKHSLRKYSKQRWRKDSHGKQSKSARNR